MILIDTSIWVDHFRRGHAGLRELLRDGGALIHPAVIGELACGQLTNRAKIFNDLDTLPCATMATDREARQLIELHRLQGTGLGWIDVHLLAAAMLTGCPLWTADRKLAATAKRLGVGA